jgi:nicotinate-nucleotide adenylyltransferase
MEADRYVNKKIGIIGGTFDPVHTGHLIVAEEARAEFGLDKVLFIPCGRPPHKKEVYVSAEHRLAMVKIAIKGNSFFGSSDMEIKRDKPSYTYDTITLARKQNLGEEVFFITGEDEFYNLESWHRYRELVKRTVFLVAPRIKKASREIPDIPFLTYRFIDMPFIDISSTYIRDCFLTGKTVKYLVPEKVIAYIRRNGLYGT